ncbi:DNA cytosine methyltransferase [Escherichia coli]|nr:DNA cytosine methyltransferase [Escherichia coli]
MIIGGPPCQDFSHAGLRIEGARANLTRSFSEIIKKNKAKVVCDGKCRSGIKKWCLFRSSRNL